MLCHKCEHWLHVPKGSMTFRLNAFPHKDILSKAISPRHNPSKRYFIEYDISSRFRLKLSKFCLKFRLKIEKKKLTEILQLYDTLSLFFQWTWLRFDSLVAYFSRLYLMPLRHSMLIINGFINQHQISTFPFLQPDKSISTRLWTIQEDTFYALFRFFSEY